MLLFYVDRRLANEYKQRRLAALARWREAEIQSICIAAPAVECWRLVAVSVRPLVSRVVEQMHKVSFEVSH